ncbi:MAG: protein kinase [Actinomycetota bacterium]|nr:protein kinase [Actinomycetota bacterium]
MSAGRRRDELEERQTGAHAFVVCSSCGRANRSDARFCDRCSGDLHSSCLECGAHVAADASFCSQCGSRVLGAATALIPQPPLPANFGAGRYEVKKMVGEGARKRVYLAHDVRLDRDVAVSQIKTEGLDEAGLTRFRREARAMGRLGGHPQIVTVHDVVEDEHDTYIVSEYMGGGSLDDLLQASPDNRLEVTEAIRIGEQVADALAHAHALGVVHRDVKPGNVWLTDDRRATLGDFGLAHSFAEERLSVEGLMVGTVAYMSPEQALGKVPDVRSDLYSLGVMLYEILCGRPPFLGPDPVAVVTQHINTTPIAPSWHNPKVPRPLEMLILSLLEKDPEKRPASADEVKERLAACASVSSSEREVAADAAPAWAVEQMAAGVFVGRSDEMEQLKRALSHALSGDGRVVLVEGEPGVGKTRLVEQLATYARLRGAQVLTARCHQEEGIPSYWPWIRMIRLFAYQRDAQTLASQLGSGAPDIAQLVSEVRDTLPDLPVPTAGKGESSRFQLFDAIATFLSRASQSQPLVLFIDDLHWADQSSLLLLQFVARQLDLSRVLVVATYRTEEAKQSRELARTIGQIVREPTTLRISLGGLSTADVARFIEETIGRPAPTELVARVHEQTEGNAFFLTEVVHLVDAQSDSEDEGSLGALKISIPPTVREVITRRLEQLSVEARRLLVRAAPIGREFRLEVLERVSDLPKNEILDRLEECVASRVLVDVEVGRRYSFAHALIADSLYEEMSSSARARAHTRIAHAMESLYGERPGNHLPELAYHFSEAGTREAALKAIDYSERAARAAYARLAFEDAARLAEDALQMIEQHRVDDQPRRCDLLLAMGEAEAKAGRVHKSRDRLMQAAEIARKLGDGERLTRAALGFAPGFMTFGTGDADEKLITLIDEALDHLSEADSILRARLLARLGVELYYCDEAERRNDVSRAAVEMARRLQDGPTLAYALNSRHHALWAPEGLDQRVAIAAEILTTAHRAGDKKMETLGRNWMIIDLLEAGDVPGVKRSMIAYDQLTQELRDPSYVWLSPLYGAMLALLEGRFDEAETLMNIALETGQRARHENAFLAYGTQLTHLRTEQGRLAEIAPAVEEFVDQYSALPIWRVELAHMYLQLGRREDAVQVFEELARNDFCLPHDLTWLLATCVLAMTCAELNDQARARVLYERLLPFAHRTAVAGPGVMSYGSVSRYLGLLAATVGSQDLARRHFEDAIAANEKMQARPWLAHTLYDYAVVLQRWDAEAHRNRALSLSRRALDLAHECEMKPLIEKIMSLKLDLQGFGSGDIRTSIDVVAAAVRREAPQLHPEAGSGMVTMLFSDIEGSTAINEAVGDARWLEILHEHNRLFRAEVVAHHGYEVRSQGDGFFVTFIDPWDAVRCAVSVQRAFDDFRKANPAFPVQLRIGIHSGPVVADAGDVYGTNVNLAARIADQAAGGQILVSQRTHDLTRDSGVLFSDGREVQLKGLSRSHWIAPIEWRR